MMVMVLSIITLILCLALICLAIWSRRKYLILQEFITGTDAISSNFSLWDNKDRLIVFNSVFKNEISSIQGLAKPGLRFEDYIRARVKNGLVPDSIGQEEEWIERRLTLHRNSPRPFQIKLRAGRWDLVDERRTKLGGIIIHGVDISELKHSEIALAESQDRFRDFATAGADWFWETDAEHKFCFISSNFEEQTSLRISTLIGRRRDETVTVDEDPTIWADHLAILDEHKPFREFIFRRQMTEARALWSTVSGVPHFSHDGAFAGYRGIGRDVTELVEARDALELSEAQSRDFAEAQNEARIAADVANRAKSDFLASMSHEFRTPLNAILGFVQLLQLEKAGKLNATQQEYAEYVLSSGQHLLNLVNEALDAAGIEWGKQQLSLKPVDAKGIARDVVRTMQPIAEKAGIRLDPVDELPAPFVIADAQRLRQALLNLMSNAIKYNRPNGSVAVAVKAENGNMRITVTDTGFGIPEDLQSEVFTPFNRLGAEGTVAEGSGLGLALCQRLVLKMGGKIDFESEADVGCRFWVEFPLDTAEETKALPASDTGEIL